MYLKSNADYIPVTPNHHCGVGGTGSFPSCCNWDQGTGFGRPEACDFPTGTSSHRRWHHRPPSSGSARHKARAAPGDAAPIPAPLCVWGGGGLTHTCSQSADHHRPPCRADVTRGSVSKAPPWSLWEALGATPRTAEIRLPRPSMAA